MAEVAVVGAGVGGLAVAARLAASGHSVRVYEAAAHTGGKLCEQVLDTPAGRFRFDAGPSLLTLPQVFADLFAATGAPLHDELRLRRLEPAIEHRFRDGTRVCTVSSRTEQRERFDAAFGAPAGASWDRLLGRGRRMYRASEATMLRGVPSARSMLAGLGGLAALAPGRSLRGLGRRMLPDPRQRLMLDRYATYTGSDPRHAPAALAMIPFLEQHFGCWYVEGGLARLGDALARRAVERGAHIHLHSPVKAIERAAGRVTGIQLADGRLMGCQVVITDIDADWGDRQLLEQPTNGAADSLAGFVVLLAVDDPVPELDHHTVLFGNDPYDAEFDAALGADPEPVADPVIYLCAPTDRVSAPAGQRAVFLLVNAPRHGPVNWDEPGLADRYADDLLDVLAARGVDLRDRIVAREVITPAGWQRRTGAPGGALYGRTLTGLRGTLRRPANRTRTRGLFRVGGSTHPGGGLPLVALSGEIVAGLVGPA